MHIHASLIIGLNRCGVRVDDSNCTFNFLEVPLAKYRSGRSHNRLSLISNASTRKSRSRRLDHAPSPNGMCLSRTSSSTDCGSKELIL
mmetsp:Transcript_9465/g.16421  ORF Transcript_9465/g.16421 Transcript_9465/m.16421 type:complete len:88 (+) Transcript_9465:73-336(+)